ncbi:prepilin-type N-terminal cleavage/methylation domain-containing protein [Myxococcota bacterium]|nr:prepilin-type N-terminal cleavage/methylation domain-containing protein [Myxococcota bacterium]MBU1537111.1 prepilin-type N-terminal cleavage/methylation domain-containing protein [Myxococcota bacterium]
MVQPRGVRHGSRGFTIIEVLMVMAIVGLVTGALAYSFKVMPRMKLKESARTLAAASRFVSTLARSNHLYHRMVLDLDAQNPEVKVEMLPPGSPIPFMDPEIPDEDDEKQLLFEDWPRFDPANPMGAVGANDVGKPVMPAEAKWAAPDTKLKTSTKLEGVRITKVVFPCMQKEYETGKIAIHYAPDGQNPAVLVYLKSSGNPEATIWIHAGTGKISYLDPNDIPGNLCIDEDGQFMDETLQEEGVQ